MEAMVSCANSDDLTVRMVPRSRRLTLVPVFLSLHHLFPLSPCPFLPISSPYLTRIKKRSIRLLPRKTFNFFRHWLKAMDVPVSDSGLVRDVCLSFECNYCDKELVHRIAQLLLPGLAAACVDSTTGDLFNSPSFVAVDMRKEMIDYLTHRSETFVAESLMRGDGTQDPAEEISNNPTEIISIFIDEFSGLKRNLLGSISGWLLSETQEDKIDDFVQDMEINMFWLVDRREAIAEVLLKNIDFNNTFHCAMKFSTAEQLAEHQSYCIFRPMNCTHEGCAAKFSAGHIEKHESVCPFKVLPCEQQCSQSLMRHEMDRHCITVCPMKLINCPFNQIGCQSTFPQCTLEKHCSEFLHSHLLYILQINHEQEASMEELDKRAELLEKSQSLSNLSKSLNVRSLTSAIKAQEAKMLNPEGEFSTFI
ncbi:uncharacterized protein [Typha angustifolia]|uniref:uncharacterized protein isoform X2 n=1 Tax=Typha angustifolia TaxID=59011 RepID=UPI003C2CF489